MLAIAGCVLVAGCVGPGPDDGGYRVDARTTVQAAASEVNTAILMLQQEVSKHTFHNFANVTVTDSESALGDVASTFESIQPPVGQIGLREQVTDQLSEAQNAMSAGLIALRYHDEEGMQTAVEDLQKAADGLDQIEGQL